MDRLRHGLTGFPTRTLLGCLGVILLAGCQRHDPGEIATGKDFTLSSGELRQTLSTLPQLPATAGGTLLYHRALNHLIDEKLLAREAKRQQLDRDPRVMQEIEASRRAILADAYTKRLTGTLPQPSDAAIRQYYHTNKARYDDRLVALLEQIIIVGPADKLTELQHMISASGHADAALAKASSDHLPMFRSSGTQATDTMTPLLAKRVEETAPGAWFSEMIDGQLLCAQVRAKQAAPLSSEQAASGIKTMLADQARAAAVAREVKQLRDDSQIKILKPAP